MLGDHRIWTTFRAQLDEVFLNAGITPNVIFKSGDVGIFGAVGTGLLARYRRKAPLHFSATALRLLVRFRISTSSSLPTLFGTTTIRTHV